LPQAEAVADLIEAVTPLQARTAFDQLEGTLTDRIVEIDAALFDLIARLEASVDFPEEGYHFVEPSALLDALDGLLRATSSLLAEGRRGRLIREGLHVAIVGKPNVGKSSLFNALAGSERAIVTAVPGTTRDLVTETVDIKGLRVTLVDSAGIRATDDPIESIGVVLARKAMEVADVVLVVVDGSLPLDDADAAILRETCQRRRVVVANKSDIARGLSGSYLPISARSGAGLDVLRDAIEQTLDDDAVSESPSITNLRHLNLVERADQALTRARNAIAERGMSLSEEFVLADLQAARESFEEISGRRAPEDVLAHIFSRFCIGK
jgi:tRNA modification GTPase